MFFFPLNLPPEVVEKYVEKNNKIKQNKKEQENDIKKMNEYKKALDNFYKNKNISFSISGMMYYSHILNEYNKLKNKYNENKDNEWNII